MKKLKLVLLGGFMALSLGLAGCSGDDGAAGLPGAPGVDGADGASGADVTVQDLANLGLVFSDDVVAMNPTLDLSQTVSLDTATGALTVHFFLTDEDGDGIDVTTEPYELRLYASELLPASGTDNPGPAWTQLISERGTPAAGSPMPGTLTLVDAETGEYTYLASTTLAPSTNVTRVTMRARFRFRDANNTYIVVANPVNASYDFLQADPGTAVASGADMVTTAACESCHGARIGDVGHGGGYTQVKTCNNCHNLNYMAAQGDPLEADLAFMIHGIHAATNIEGLEDFTEVTYPQEINNCSKCHDGANASLAYSNPTRSNCGSCHIDVDFEQGTNHSGGPQADDAACSLCHSAANIENVYHSPAPAAIDTPEFDVAISMTAPANGTHYLAGEAPVVTVTLASADGGSEVDYTAAADGKGTRDGLLNSANLYVYGPRAHAVPVLAVDTMQDPAYVAPPTQGHKLFIGSDAQVTTTAAGFSYQLLPISADMESGTYMVRFEGGDYGAVSETDYVTTSTAVINFQVGTADVEAKLSGSACLDCHGDTRMHLQGAHPHNAAFDTDHCLGCHDFSGNYGDYIGNRVHAVHRASVTGDSISNHPTDWSEVTFPQPANNCLTCHTDTDAETPVWETPTMLACGGCHGTDTAATPEDYPTADPDRVMEEAAAAQHMAQMGGSTVSTEDPTQQCVVCHGPGRSVDLVETHNLIQFRELPTDPNE